MTDVREYFKRWPRLYYLVALVFGPMFFCGLSSKRFLKKYDAEGMTLNLGSGPKVLAPDVTNVDITKYAGVNIVADVCAVPLPDECAGRIVSDNVLEHVGDPRKAVAEMKRLLKVGGYAYVCTPFLYPFHSSPSDYQRWTAEGYKKLFEDFEMVELGMRAGPFSALDVYLCHLTGTIFSFGSPSLNSVITNLALFVFWPVKLLDAVFNYWPNAIGMASVIYCVIRKP